MSIDAEHENRLDSQLRSAYKEGLAPNIAVSAEGLQLFKAPEDASTGASMASVRQAYEDAKPNGTGLTPVSGTTLVGTDSDKMMHDDDNQENGLEVVDRE